MTKFELLQESIKLALDGYDEKRQAAAEILDSDGMEEAIIDELVERGFTVISAEYTGKKATGGV